MGCCSCRSLRHSKKTPDEINFPNRARRLKDAKQYSRLKERDAKHYYEITFPSKPFHITLTSAFNKIDGYITSVEKGCPIPNAEKKIILNSKVIRINGVFVEGSNVSQIAEHLYKGMLPLTLVLVHPEALDSEEVPDFKPEQIVVRQFSEGYD